MTFRTVLFDWRGTLVVTPPEEAWVGQALQRLGRDSSVGAVQSVLSALVDAKSERLDEDRLDCSQMLHRESYFRVFEVAGLDDELASALYDIESDWSFNPFVADASSVLQRLSDDGMKLGIVSDIHFDLRPAFRAEGLEDVVTSFVLSFEHGVQKPDPAIFRIALEQLGATSETTLMVGDRAAYDGAAIDVGITTLLVPPAASVEDRRLHLVEAFRAAASA